MAANRRGRLGKCWAGSIVCGVNETRQHAEPLPLMPRHDRAGLVWLVIALGILARLIISAISIGSDDIQIWERFGRGIADKGLLALYHSDPDFNHPPLPAYWAAIAFIATRHAPAAFPFVFRLAGIAADILSCAVLYRIASRRAGGQRSITLPLAMAWSPCAILISAHHGSTDSIYAAFALLAAWCAAQGSFLGASLALGAAINVKIIPVILIPPMLSLCRDRRSALRFIGGLAIMTAPFIP